MATTAERRSTSPVLSEDVWLGTEIPHHKLYPAVGLLLGLCSPLGAFALRYISADPVLTGEWAISELEYNSGFYIYMAVVSTLSFMAYGYAVGLRSETQRGHNAALRKRMEDLHLKSITDGLTGAYSHAYLQETLAMEMEGSHRRGHPTSVLMLDLDDFKSINDDYGHLFGDQVLKEVTETISMNIRQQDILGRYGGEEFLVIMPGADEETANRVAQRVCDAVARAGIVNAFDPESRRTVPVTLSIGVSTISGGKTHAPQSIILRADQNLYRAKGTGKNRVYSSIERGQLVR